MRSSIGELHLSYLLLQPFCVDETFREIEDLTKNRVKICLVYADNDDNDDDDDHHQHIINVIKIIFTKQMNGEYVRKK